MATSTSRPVDQPGTVLVQLDPGGPVVCGSRSPFLRADDLGVLRGDGVFERFVVDGGSPRHFEEHLVRLDRSARLADIELPARAAWKEAVELAVESWQGAAEWEMRLVCTRGPEEGGPPTAYVLGQELGVKVFQQRAAGVSVLTLARGLQGGLTDEAPWLLLGVKTLSYAVNMAAKRWAESRGADDAIFVGADGAVWEAASSAVITRTMGASSARPHRSASSTASASPGSSWRRSRLVGRWPTTRSQCTTCSKPMVCGCLPACALRGCTRWTTKRCRTPLTTKSWPPWPPPARQRRCGSGSGPVGK